MTLDKIFYGYMTVVGLAAGAILIAFPSARDFFITPFFWVLTAVFVFDLGSSFLHRNAPWAMMPTPTRMIGFGIGIALLVAIPMLAGFPFRLF
jgi:hypothetical protein